MSKKIKLLIPNKIKPNLHNLFHLYIERKGKERASSHNSMYDMYDEYDYETLMQLGLFGYSTEDDYDFDNADVVFPFNSKSKKSRNDDDAYARYWDNVERKREARRAAKAARRNNVVDADYIEIGSERKKGKHRHRGKSKKLMDLSTPYSGWEEEPDIIGDGTNFDERPRYDNDMTIWFYPNYNNKDDKLEFDSLKDFDDFCADEGFFVPPYISEELVYRPINHVCLRPDARERGINEIFAAESYGDMVYEVCNVEELSQ